MSLDSNIGGSVAIFCLCSFGPMLIGFVIGWSTRGRWSAYGGFGGLVRSFFPPSKRN